MANPFARIDPLTLVFPSQHDGAVLAVIDLDGVADDAEWHLPACPLIGIGDRAHPHASRCDLLVEPPVSLDALVTAIEAQPHAAAILVQLLRLTETMAIDAALVAESMAYGLLQGSAGHSAWLVMQGKPQLHSPGAVHAVRDDDRLDICLARPHADNAIDRPMRDALREIFDLAALDRDVAHIRLRAEGRSFSLGADLAEFGTTRDPATAHAIRMAALPAHSIAQCADRLEAHVQGACVGSGLEMAAFAARLTASRFAWFQLPELAMGILPGAGGCISVARRIGRQRAALMMLSGKRIGARTALDWGLVDAIIDD
ncbi:enoyl-CoA hydratase/isomerase family protein [Sphingobium sp. BYY-5]|uniref:enoyl-CoA hydratase/isomerase family protein n=1 Tax=Sphingobium sp. BYY-5 TaxID=2926400 RepID=UPI001FA79CE5|nr:enoyl-CoA hydratase/isomerase family protein [Sphingobium sp. BYY-5]MCI4592041.1 enoyl-CoA hydratase/isomerase family protein [Sphingobium sp. BYY-5]